MLVVKNLGRKIETRWLWQAVNFELTAGTGLGLVGPSGAGKTLLLRTLVALDPADCGEVHFEGRSLSQWSMPHYRTQVIYLPQRPALVEGRVEENLQAVFHLKVHQGQRQYDRQRILTYLATLDRGVNFLNRPVDTLSGGESQILALIRALQLNPRILLLDEPTAALDPVATAQIEQLVTHWLQADPSRAFLLTSHDPQQMSRLTTQQFNLGQFLSEVAG